MPDNLQKQFDALAKCNEEHMQNLIGTVNKAIEAGNKSVSSRLKTLSWIIGGFLTLITVIIIFALNSNDSNTRNVVTLMTWKEMCDKKLGEFQSDIDLIKKNALKKDRFNISMKLLEYKVDELKGIAEHNDLAVMEARKEIKRLESQLMAMDTDDVTRGIE
jgi:hypothetical protein